MSSAPAVKGVNGVTLTRRRKSWSKERGESYVETWSGPLDKATTYYESLIGEDGVSDINLEPGGDGSGTVTVTRPAVEDGASGAPDEELAAVWEIVPNEFVRDLRQHPYFFKSGSIARYIQEADDAISRGELYDYANVPSWSTYVQRYLGLKLAGVDGYLFNGLIIRKTIATSERPTINIAWADSGFVVSFESIGVPAELVGTIQSSIERVKAGELGSGERESGQWEWLKKAPTIRTDGSSKRYQIVYEWWGADQWSKVLYGGTWDPTANW